MRLCNTTVCFKVEEIRFVIKHFIFRMLDNSFVHVDYFHLINFLLNNNVVISESSQ